MNDFMGKPKRLSSDGSKEKKLLSRSDSVPRELLVATDGEIFDDDRNVINDARAAKEGKRKLHEELNNVANSICKLLVVIKGEIDKEDIIRQELLAFLKKFLVMVVAVPPFFVIALVLLRPDLSANSIVAATVAAVLAIPASVIGVLKCVADNLFNDTYRSTLPGMIQDLSLIHI